MVGKKVGVGMAPRPPPVTGPMFTEIHGMFITASLTSNESAKAFDDVFFPSLTTIKNLTIIF